MSRKTSRYRIKIQNEAVDELDKIYSFIGQDSPTSAKRFIRALQRQILKLRDFPRRGRRVRLLEGGLSLEIRFVEYRDYLIFYTIGPKEVIVLHIAGPGQNWLRLFF